jgi:hypothetical protein
MRRSLLLLLGSTLLLGSIGWNVVTAGPTASKNACEQKVIRSLIDERDRYRMVVFGSRKDGTENVSLLGGPAPEEQRGIFETPKRLTSELVHPLTESYRSLRCQFESVCSFALASFDANDPSVTVSLLGCTPVTQPRYEECSLSNGQDKASDIDQAAIIEIQSECQRLIADALSAEKAILKTAVSYDSGYRSMLQSSGMLDDAIMEAETKNLRPLQKLINSLGRLHQIPCFISQCDHPAQEE